MSQFGTCPGVTDMLSFKASLLDNRTMLYVNINGHPGCGLPVHATGEKIESDHLETRGIDNLRVPIDVGMPAWCEDPTQSGRGATSRSSDVAAAPVVVELSSGHRAPLSGTTAGAGMPSKKSVATIEAQHVFLDVFICPPLVHMARRSCMDNVPGAVVVGGDARVDLRRHTLQRLMVLIAEWIKRDTGLTLAPKTVSFCLKPHVLPGGGAPTAASKIPAAFMANLPPGVTVDEAEKMYREAMKWTEAQMSSQRPPSTSAVSRVGDESAESKREPPPPHPTTGTTSGNKATAGAVPEPRSDGNTGRSDEKPAVATARPPLVEVLSVSHGQRGDDDVADAQVDAGAAGHKSAAVPPRGTHAEGGSCQPAVTSRVFLSGEEDSGILRPSVALNATGAIGGGMAMPKGTSSGPLPTTTSASAAPAVREMPSRSATDGLRRGFFNDRTAPSLYGPEGSREGVLPEGAGDPLGHIPKSFREKCQIIDVSKGMDQATVTKPRSEQQQQPEVKPSAPPPVFRDVKASDPPHEAATSTASASSSRGGCLPHWRVAVQAVARDGSLSSARLTIVVAFIPTSGVAGGQSVVGDDRRLGAAASADAFWRDIVSMSGMDVEVDADGDLVNVTARSTAGGDVRYPTFSVGCVVVASMAANEFRGSLQDWATRGFACVDGSCISAVSASGESAPATSSSATVEWTIGGGDTRRDGANGGVRWCLDVEDVSARLSRKQRQLVIEVGLLPRQRTRDVNGL